MDNNPKIYNCSIECKLVGYLDNSKAYHCWDKRSGWIHTTLNAVFAESQDLRERALHPGLILDNNPSDNVDEASPCSIPSHAELSLELTPDAPLDVSSSDPPEKLSPAPDP